LISNNISQISSVSHDSLGSSISSHFLHLRNENQLFEFVQNQIKENREYLIFLRYVYFGLVESNHLINLINTIQFDEMDHCLFEHLQSDFFSNYLLSFENEVDCKDDPMLFFSENIEEYFEEDKKNKEIKFLFEFYPILLPNVLEIESNSQIVLSFTEKQTKLVKQFKYIEVITGGLTFLVQKSRLFQEYHIFIFIPISITSLCDGCFKDYSSFSQISLPNSITSLGDECFCGCSSLSQISLPNSITSLRNSCFRDCFSLSLIKLSNNISSENRFSSNESNNSCIR
jgi:hypothetical protein